MPKHRKYPGRDRVMSRDDARDYLWRQSFAKKERHPCSSPYVIHAIGLPSMFEANHQKLPLEMHARCRKCEQCLAHRRRLWTARAVDEIKASSRTWFGTLTVRPVDRVRIQYLAERLKLRASGEAFSSLDPADQYRMLSTELGKSVTKWLKLVRKTASFRYLLVFEAHKDGFPHMHILVHEQGTPLRKADLEAKWRLGFSHWRLVGEDTRASVYVCKYLAKDALTRVRASQSYGQQHRVQRLTEQLTQVTATLRASTGE